MKKLLVLVLALSLPLVVFANGTQEESEQYVMKVGTIENVNNLGAKAVDRFGRIMAERTDGKFIVEAYHASQLGDTTKLLQQVKSGTIQAFRGSIASLGRIKGDLAITECIYLYESAEQAENLIKGPTIQGLNDEMADEHNIRFVTASWTRLPRHILTKDPVKNLDDLQGVKIRVPDAKTYIEAFKAMGATPTPVAFNEAYLAIKQGLVDGAENHVESLYNMKWYEVAKNLTLTGHSYDVTGFSVNDDWWQSLPTEYQELFVEVDAEVNDWFVEELAKLEQYYIDLMVDSGVKVWEVNTAEFRNKVIPQAAYNIEKEGFWREGLFDQILKEMN